MFKRLIAVFILLIFPISTLAHSPLEQASPMNGAILTTPPTEYKIRFKSPAKLIKIEIYQKSQSAKKKVSFLENILKKSDEKLVKLNHKPSFALTKSHSISYLRLNLALTKFAGEQWGKTATF